MPHIEIKRWDTGEVIFAGEFECVRDCLEEGVKNGKNFYRANLSGANLSGANLNYTNLNYTNLNYTNLSDANLSRANLSDANLSDAKLSGAKLSDANLSDANLSRANLSDANLSDAKLSGAKLNYTTGNSEQVVCLKHGIYKLVAVLPTKVLHGGCETKSFNEWLAYDGDSLDEYDKNYLETVTKPFIKLIIGMQKDG